MAADQAPPSLGFSQGHSQSLPEHWSGLPFPSPMHESEKWKWSHSVMSNSPQLLDCSLSRSSIHGICQARVQWQATPVLLPRKSHGWRSLVAAVHGVTTSRMRLSDFTFTFHFHAMEKAMATHSSVLAWRIPGMAEPGGLPSMESHRVGNDWSNLAILEWVAIAFSERFFYNTTIERPQSFGAQPFFMIPFSHLYMPIGKPRTLTIQNLSANYWLCFLIHYPGMS